MQRALLAWCLASALAFGVACSTPPPPAAPEPATGKLRKRAGPPAVPTLRLGAAEFAAVHWGTRRGLEQNGGYLAALDPATGRELWLLRVYEVRYDPARERDAQEVFIVELKAGPQGTVLVSDELGRVFVVDPVARTARPR